MQWYRLARLRGFNPLGVWLLTGGRNVVGAGSSKGEEKRPSSYVAAAEAYVCMVGDLISMCLPGGLMVAVSKLPIAQGYCAATV